MALGGRLYLWDRQASSKTIGISINKAVKTAREAITTASEAARMAEKALKTPHKVMDTGDEANEIVEVGCSTITAMDQATSRVHGALSKASDNQQKCRGSHYVACKEGQVFKEIPFEGDEGKVAVYI